MPPRSMVTVLPAWVMPTWMRGRATWMPARLEPFRRTARRDCGSGSGPVRRTLWKSGVKHQMKLRCHLAAGVPGQ